MDLAPLGSALSTKWPIDWIIVLVVLVLFTLDAYRSGSSRSTAIALAALLSGALLSLMQGAALAGPIALQFAGAQAQAALFAVIFVGTFLLLYRVVYTFADASGLLKPLLCGASATVVLIATWVGTPALSAVWQFGPSIHALFGSAYAFWWTVAALIGLAIARS